MRMSINVQILVGAAAGVALGDAVKALEQALATDPANKELQQQLAVQYHQVQRSAEALALLFEILKQDLNFGEAKKLYLDILATLPKGEPLASSYRRKLYSLLY